MALSDSKGEYPRLRITGGPHAMNSRVFLDDYDISRYVCRTEVVCDVNNVNRAQITLVAVEFEIDAEAQIVIDRSASIEDDKGWVDTSGLSNQIRTYARPRWERDLEAIVRRAIEDVLGKDAI